MAFISILLWMIVPGSGSCVPTKGEQRIEQMPFPIQRIQTDRGREFFAYEFQEKLQECGIKFRPIKPRSPNLNGKVERSQQTDLREFYVTADLKDKNLNDRLEE